VSSGARGSQVEVVMPGCAALVRRGWDTDLAQHVAPTRHVRVQQEVLYRFPTEMEPGQHWGNTTS